MAHVDYRELVAFDSFQACDLRRVHFQPSSRSEDEFFRTACNAPSALRVQLSTDGQPGSFEYKVPNMMGLL